MFQYQKFPYFKMCKYKTIFLSYKSAYFWGIYDVLSLETSDNFNKI